MSDSQALAAFLDKWRERWPEWNVAGIFVAPPQRAAAAAWFALIQELTDAAWAGEDPRPGEAKLGWWADELLGWAQGRRRHPLGMVLQKSPAPWARLAGALPSLLAMRDAETSRDAAFAAALPMAEAVSGVDASLFAGPAATPLVESVLTRHLLLRGDAAAPLQLRARIGQVGVAHGLAQAWAAELLQSWPGAHRASRPERIFAALLRQRARAIAAGVRQGTPVGRFPTLWSSWRAARG